MEPLQEPQNCLFCRIVSGELPSHKVYEDDYVVVFLDIRPVNRGHVLVVTKDHYQNVHDIPEDLVAHLYKVVKFIAAVEDRAFSPQGIGIAQNNGEAAGQIIFHFHVHVIPKDMDGHQRYEASEEELIKVAEELKKAIVELQGR